MSDESQVPAFVAVEWLDERLGDPSIRVLDARGRVAKPGEPARSMRPDYDAAHIPGAAFVDPYVTFVDPSDPVPAQLASPERFTEAASALGIGPTTHVVVYDDLHSIFAGRTWWSFRAMGHHRVSVLDGGWNAWRAAGLQSTTQEPTFDPTQFVARPRPHLRANLDNIVQLINERPADTQLIDARAADRYAGTGFDAIGGHIPGAISAPYSEFLDEEGRIRDDASLRAAFRRAGVAFDHPERRFITTCGSGISATIPLLALTQLVPDALDRCAVYDGSWAEWSASGQPIARGALPG